MFKRPTKKILLFWVHFAVCVFLTTCGLEEYYYLPQVPETYINTQFNTSATINLPSLNGYYYAQNYKIFYRIYISDVNTSSIETNDTELKNINSTLLSDYKSIYPNTDPTSTTMGTPAGTLFTNRNYYELELYQDDKNKIITSSEILTTSGGNIEITFPPVQGGFPVLQVNNNGTEIRLYRSRDSNNFFSTTPIDDKRYFRNTSDINVPDYADLVPLTNISPTYAYVSMYVVAVGINQNFTSIYSKPTHISVFKLPDN